MKNQNQSSFPYWWRLWKKLVFYKTCFIQNFAIQCIYLIINKWYTLYHISLNIYVLSRTIIFFRSFLLSSLFSRTFIQLLLLLERIAFLFGYPAGCVSPWRFNNSLQGYIGFELYLPIKSLHSYILTFVVLYAPVPVAFGWSGSIQAVD